MDEVKQCSKCGRLLPIDEFSKRRGKSKIDGHWIDGLNGQCKQCISERKALWLSLHPDYHKEYYNQHHTLSPLMTKVCCVCGKEFDTNKPNQVRCHKDCKPDTPIRRLKAYLKAHPEIDKKEFFKERYKVRYKGRYIGRYKEQSHQYRINHREERRLAKCKYRANKKMKDIFLQGIRLP